MEFCSIKAMHIENMRNSDFNPMFENDIGLGLKGTGGSFQNVIDNMLHIVCGLVITHVIYHNLKLVLICASGYGVYKILHAVCQVDNICPGVGIGYGPETKNHDDKDNLRQRYDASSNLTPVAHTGPDHEISNSLENLCNDDWVGGDGDSDYIETGGSDNDDDDNNDDKDCADESKCNCQENKVNTESKYKTTTLEYEQGADDNDKHFKDE